MNIKHLLLGLAVATFFFSCSKKHDSEPSPEEVVASQIEGEWHLTDFGFDGTTTLPSAEEGEEGTPVSFEGKGKDFDENKTLQFSSNNELASDIDSIALDVEVNIGVPLSIEAKVGDFFASDNWNVVTEDTLQIGTTKYYISNVSNTTLNLKFEQMPSTIGIKVKGISEDVVPVGNLIKNADVEGSITLERK